jgi:exodeoxyribonuclease V
MDLTGVIAMLRKEFPYEPTDGQDKLLGELAVFLTLSWKQQNALFILRGYAGTGKTTVVKALVDVLPRIGKKTALLAPTGRAAKVLTSYTRKEANTIHRKIYFARTNKDGLIDLKLQVNYHKHTLFIVDEASMIQHAMSAEGTLFSTRNLLDDLFQFVYSGENCRMLFIGDAAQLPPVGLDHSPALDHEFLKRAYHLNIDTFELTEVVRQAKESGILVNATQVRQQIQLQKLGFPMFSIGGYRDIKRLNGQDLEEALNHAWSGTQKENNVVICRSNKDPLSRRGDIHRRSPDGGEE